MAAVGLLRNPRLFAHDEEEGMRLSASGTLADPALAFEIAIEYLALAAEYPPPEFRCIRDHLQTLLQGLLQFELPAVWSLLGNDYCTDTTQYRELLRLAGACSSALFDFCISLSVVNRFHPSDTSPQPRTTACWRPWRQPPAWMRPSGRGPFWAWPR